MNELFAHRPIQDQIGALVGIGVLMILMMVVAWISIRAALQRPSQHDLPVRSNDADPS